MIKTNKERNIEFEISIYLRNVLDSLNQLKTRNPFCAIQMELLVHAITTGTEFKHVRSVFAVP